MSSRLTLSRVKRKRTSGFRKRMSTRPGQRIINRKRRKGRSVNLKNRL